MKKKIFSILVLISMLLGLVSSASAASSSAVGTMATESVISKSGLVVRVYFTSQADLASLASRYDILDVNHEQGYATAILSSEEYTLLLDAGYRLEIDQAKTALINKPFVPLPGQGTDSIPGYPCYRTVEETYTTIQDLAANNPGMAELLDIGDSWDKVMPGGNPGYDIYALRLTNESFGDVATKPTFFLMAEIHARELVTAETATRYAEHLITNYGIDPDITWLLDYFRVYIVTMTNPDGRKFAETGEWWRKNVDNDDGCTDPNNWGTDLNRNFSFKWNMGGSDDWPCGETYHGPSAASEPETQTIQMFLSTIFTDQRGPGDTDPAPIDANGLMVTLHSAAGLVLWPWGWSGTHAPNHTQLQTLGRHLAFYNNYYPEQSIGLYPTSGTTDDWSYGTLGIASFTFEMGTDFFQDCSSFNSYIYPNNRDALLYAFKTARLPYMTPAGPDTLNVVVSPVSVPPGLPVQLTAVANDTHYNNQNGTEPVQNITAAHYSIDAPAWVTGTITYTMTASDGNFNSTIENLEATVNTGSLTPGRHTIYVESMDAGNHWGITSAVFLDVTEPLIPAAEFTSNSPVPLGTPISFTNQTIGTEPITYTWDFGDGIGTSTETNPAYTYAAIGVYTVTLDAVNALGSDSISHTVTVEPAAIASVDLTLVTTATIYAGDSVDFSADLLPDNAGKPFDYQIDFGDGSVVTGTSLTEPLLFNHVFHAGGAYHIQISAWNDFTLVPVSDSLELWINFKLFLPLASK